MGIERNRWVRWLLIAQLAVLWPVSLLLWAAGGGLRLAFAVVLLWLGAIACITGIVLPWRSSSHTPDRLNGSSEA
ncbi:hypothetical protein [Saccharopolyspora rectivirgula]|jgi:hypothetical protein|uniref:hypothetical protein n=1 Tax=Saccharopolyspora rectivirgula TaxID=28042 RepID=UPI0003F72048|nr:hypothetical protein [Saccharopolyspora rectivirgula]